MLLVRSLLLLFWLLGAEVAADSEVQQHGPFQIFKRNNPNDLTPSFLETEIEEVQEEIFPAKLNISLTLGLIRGLLFYSFDKNNNQLILSLFENDQIYIKVKLRNDDFTEDLVSLCGCKRNCLFETLNLTLEIPSSTLRIQCNGRPAVEHKVPSAVDIDRNYPAIKVGSNSKKNAARMWMVNHPRIGSSIPETRQMVGCIHAVRYRDRDVALSARGPQLRQDCPDACTKQADICNSGSCVGTLNDRPVCDCTAALLMGKTCTDKLNTNSSKTAVFDYRFSSLKVSWSNGTNRRILLLQLKTFNITLFSEEEELRLQLKFYTNVTLTTPAEVLLHKYDPRHAHTAILRFQEEKITIQMPLDNDSVFLIPLERSPELGSSFVNLTLYSQPGGAADAAIRYTELDMEWSKIDWTILEDKSALIIVENSSEKKMSVTEIVLGYIGMVVAAVAAVTALIVALKRKMPQKLWRRFMLLCGRLCGRRRRDDPEAPLLVGETPTVDDGAALWEIVRSLLRQYCELKTVSMTVKAPEGYSMKERKLKLRKILDNLEMRSKVDPYVTKHIKLNRQLLSADEVDMERLRYHLQMLTLAITNAAIARASDGKANSASEPPHVRLLRAVYAKLRHVGTAYLTQDNKVQAWSRTSFIGAVNESKMTLSTTLDNIRNNSEYERDKFVRRRCSEIEERIRKMGESAECSEWINHVRLLGGPIQLLMLAIVNIRLGEGPQTVFNDIMDRGDGKVSRV